MRDIFGDLFITESDIVYTPDHVSKHIIDFLNPSGACLDPCKGDGAFHKFLPLNKWGGGCRLL